MLFAYKSWGILGTFIHQQSALDGRYQKPVTPKCCATPLWFGTCVFIFFSFAIHRKTVVFFVGRFSNPHFPSTRFRAEPHRQAGLVGHRSAAPITRPTPPPRPTPPARSCRHRPELGSKRPRSSDLRAPRPGATGGWSGMTPDGADEALGWTASSRLGSFSG